MSKNNNPGIGGRGKRAPYETTGKYRGLVSKYEVDDKYLVTSI